MRVDFTVRNGVELGDRTEAAIKTETVLGTKMLELTPRGDGTLSGPIPLERTTSPYDLPDGTGRSDHHHQRPGHHAAVRGADHAVGDVRRHPADSQDRPGGRGRDSPTPSTPATPSCAICWPTPTRSPRCWPSAATRSPALVVNTNALLAELLAQRDSIDALMNNLTAVSQQISGLVADNRDTAQARRWTSSTACWSILDNRKSELQRTLYLLRRYAMSFGEVLGSGPFFKASLVEPAARPVRPAVHRRRVLRSGPGPQRAAALAARRPGCRPAGHTAAAGAVPADRPGRRAAPDAARRDHRQPRRPALPDREPLPGRHPAATAAGAAACAAARRAATGAARARPGPGVRAAADRRRRRCRSGQVTDADHQLAAHPRRADRHRDHPGRHPRRRDHRGGTPWWATSPRTPTSPTSPTPTASTPATRSASSASRSARSTRSNPSRDTPKVTFSVDSQYPVPADARAAILSPSLVSARAIQLVPAYSGGPKLAAGADDPAGAHRGAGRVGRLPRSSWRSSPTRCSRPTPGGPSTRR